MGSNSRSSAAAETDFQVPLILEVLQGRTQFRDRPVTSNRFLIGSGPACDLRLGGSEVPAVHSLIVCEPDGITLEALVPAPALIHNGQAAISVRLQDGDLIRIGALEFRAHVTGRLPQATQPLNTPVPLGIAEETAAASEISSLLASELVERIEQEDAEIEDFERRRSQGAAALLQAAAASRKRPTRRDRLDGPQSGPPAPHFHAGVPEIAAASKSPSAAANESSQLMNELGEIGRTLQLLSQEIQTRSQRSTERELTLAQTISQLLDAQQRLVTQLEQVTRQVHALQSRDNVAMPKSRAIA